MTIEDLLKDSDFANYIEAFHQNNIVNTDVLNILQSDPDNYIRILNEIEPDDLKMMELFTFLKAKAPNQSETKDRSKIIPEKKPSNAKSLSAGKVESKAIKPPKSGAWKKWTLFGSVFLLIGLSLVYLMSGSAEAEVEVEKEKGIFVAIASLNFRDGNSVDANTIGSIPFGEQVEYIGEVVGPIYQDNMKVLWQQIKWKEQKGWIAVEIDSQTTTGSKESLDALEALEGGTIKLDSEYGRMRIWARHEAIKFLKEKSWLGRYHFMYIDEFTREKGYRALIKYHSGSRYSTNDPYDYVLLLGSDDGDRITLFLKAKQDRQGGSVVGWTELPQNAATLKLKENKSEKTNKISVHDSGNGSLGLLDDRSYNYSEFSGEINRAEISGLVMEYDYEYSNGNITWEPSNIEIVNGGTGLICYDSYRPETLCLYGEGSNLRMEFWTRNYRTDELESTWQIGFSIANKKCFIFDELGDINESGYLKIYAGDQVIFQMELQYEGCM